MSAALKYCTRKFKKALIAIDKKNEISKAFKLLDVEINKLDYMVQIKLYTASTQLLETLIQNSEDLINPLDIYVLQCNSIINGSNETIVKVGLALAVIAIALSVFVLTAGLGIGIGMLLGLWQTPLIFMTSLFAAEAVSLAVATSSVVAGVGAGFISQYYFFKEPKIKIGLDNCVEAIKHSYLGETELEEDVMDDSHEIGRVITESVGVSNVIH